MTMKEKDGHPAIRQANGEWARLHAWVGGRVQGVFFRAFTQRKAQALGLKGGVRNLPDGRVEVVAEGPKAALLSLAAWLRKGSPASCVESVVLQWEAAENRFAAFEIWG